MPVRSSLGLRVVLYCSEKFFRAQRLGQFEDLLSRENLLRAV
jgi:hypothetical protein